MFGNVRTIVARGVLPVALATPICIFINDNLLEYTYIHGRSMQPTLSPDYHLTGARDIVFWQKFSPTRDLQRGAIVMFNSPQRPESSAVKRVIALEGDIVVLDPKRKPADIGRVRVPPGHVWVEGDNWRETLDSNVYGAISKGLISGRAMFVAWPWLRAGKKPWNEWENGTGRKTKVITGPVVERVTVGE
ncbi:LexA/Signal peptidase [Dissoconium aciculare CBS 342.82]|uniref:Mitochondrial inner membrane protease subunit 2 n=1 Tax=Dissoconium aciculare CBS 342.82 TaxID=1314786 RepID=A0A6J3MKG1_9PEZI|nr:LexA/Signal peptidase [Dissoconium aciculare CBS 342.82]KAF1827447.1 LexA/Signal peptidase [Dissoconium aciculare CBS 342.82]